MRKILIILLTLIVASLFASPVVIPSYTISTHSGSMVAKTSGHAQNTLRPNNTNKHILPAFSASSVLHVDKYGGEGYSTIQDAIDNASDGDTVFVHNGVYRENVRIYKSIRLVGESRDFVVIDGGKRADTVLIVADNVVVENFTIKNSGNFDAGVKINSDGNCIRGCRIVECWDGVELNSANHNKIQECEIAYNSWSGLGFYNSKNNVIEDCYIHNNLDGILIISSSLNVVKSCKIRLNEEEGVELERNSNKNMFCQNKIDSNGGYGIFIYWQSDETYISCCNITRNSAGISIGSIFRGGGNGTTILGNNITANAGPGIFLLGNGKLISNTQIHYNNIYDNSEGISARYSSNCVVYAQNNWWGSKFGPSIFKIGFGDSILWNPTNSKIYFYPWLKKPFNAANTRHFKADKDEHNTTYTIPIDPMASYTTHKPVYIFGKGNYSTIQDAIDNASDGDTVFVHNGVYRENVRIYKSIRLVGESRDFVVIDGGKRADTVLIVADNVVVENFTIKNSGNFDAGVKINSDGNCIRGCRIVECWDGVELNSANHNKIQECEIYNNLKEGIYLSYADNNTIIDCNLPNNLESIWLDSSNYNTIKNCIVESNAEEGIQIKSSSHNRFISCKILSNTFGYGMFIEHESNDNLISKCEISYNGVGVFFSTRNRAPSNNTIVYSHIVNNSGTGIFFIGNGSLIKNTHIHFNNIYGNKKGMVSINSPGCIVYAQNNWWGSKFGPSIFRVGVGDTIMWSLTNGRIYFYPWLKKPVE